MPAPFQRSSDIQNMWWLGLTAAGVIVGVLCLTRVLSRRSSADIEVGNVSENWLSEQRGRKD